MKISDIDKVSNLLRDYRFEQVNLSNIMNEAFYVSDFIIKNIEHLLTNRQTGNDCANKKELYNFIKPVLEKTVAEFYEKENEKITLRLKELEEQIKQI